MRSTTSASTTTATPSRHHLPLVFKSVDKRGTSTSLQNGPVTSLDDANLLYKQTYTLDQDHQRGQKVTYKESPRHGRTSFAGEKSIPSYADLRDEPHGHTGRQDLRRQADDPFFLDLRVFDLLYGGACRRPARTR